VLLEAVLLLWDPVLCFLIRRKLDQQSLGALENSADAPTEIPTLWSVLTFIEQRAFMLETISAQPTATFRHQSVHNEESCKICHLGQHNLRACSRFQQMYPKARRQAIIQVGACTNCLSTAHKVKNCGSPTTCLVCQQRHHSLLHQGPTSNPVAGVVTNSNHVITRANGSPTNMSLCNRWWITGESYLKEDGRSAIS